MFTLFQLELNIYITAWDIGGGYFHKKKIVVVEQKKIRVRNKK